MAASSHHSNTFGRWGVVMLRRKAFQISRPRHMKKRCEFSYPSSLQLCRFTLCDALRHFTVDTSFCIVNMQPFCIFIRRNVINLFQRARIFYHICFSQLSRSCTSVTLLFGTFTCNVALRCCRRCFYVKR